MNIIRKRINDPKNISLFGILKPFFCRSVTPSSCDYWTGTGKSWIIAKGISNICIRINCLPVIKSTWSDHQSGLYSYASNWQISQPHHASQWNVADWLYLLQNHGLGLSDSTGRFLAIYYYLASLYHDECTWCIRHSGWCIAIYRAQPDQGQA